MHLLIRFLLLGFVSSVLGNIWVFGTEYDHTTGYQFFNCDEESQATWWQPEHDELEANVYAVHFTIYKNRGYKIFDTGGNEHGFFQLVRSVTWDCVYAHGQDEFLDISIFHCNSDYTVEHING
ncbi:hypothetical protein PG994_014058 [Apiospora phragmitis]|uniref:Uncharacterized protein n=1 Tax=Apiospora phragmitis TaxID=2905665 RepID=A0ABR1T387_9PEZI